MTRKYYPFCPGLFCVMLSLFSLSPSVWAQPTASAFKPVFRHYTVTKGLPSHEVYCLLQDSKGYLWFGTDRGVARYDGYQFKVFTSEEGMCDNTVFNIYEDQKGRVWFATFSGKLSYYQDGVIYGIPANRELEDLRRVADISSISVDTGDTIWLGISRTRGLIKIAPGSTKLQWQKTSSAHYLKIRSNGDLLAGNPGLAEGTGFLLSVETQSSQHMLELKAAGISGWSRTPRALKINSREYAYAAEGMVVRLTEMAILSHYDYPAQVNNIFRDSKGQIWVCHGNKGVSLLGSDSSQKFLEGLTVTAAAEDWEGNFWFTTLENGVFMLPSAYFRSYTLPQKTNITRFAVNKEGLWAGLADGHLLRIDKNEQVSIIKVPGSGKGVDYLRSINTDKDGNLFVGGNKTYLYANGRFKPVLDFGLKHLTREEPGRPTIGVMVESVFQYQDAAFCQLLSDARFRKFIDALHYDSNNVVWIGNLRGLWSFRDTITYHGNEHPLLSFRIRDISSSSKKLWLATLGAGLLIKQDGKIYQVNTSHGLLSNMCNSLFVENENLVWVCTNKGLNRVQIIDAENGIYRIDSYTSQDGLLSDEVLYVSRFQDKIWVACGEGITCFNPAQVQGERVTPPVYISDFQVNGIETSNAAASLLDLNYKQNLVDINYIGISFRSGNKLMYRYKLEGWENEWNYTNNTSVRYPNLEPGNYSFVVYAQNSQNAWSAEPAVIKFSIAKPFWETAWFICGTVALLVVLICAGFSYRINSIKRKVREKNELHKKQVELELKALRAQMNPHFTFNTMNSIQDFIMQKDTDSASEYLIMFASLMRRILNNSRNAFIKLQEELEAVRLYLELEVMRLDGRFSYSISCDDELYPGFAKIPPLLLQPYVENAIWHGLMPKEGKGVLSIRISKDDDRIRCIIRDNGIGRKKAEELRAQRGIKHESMGLNITDERLRLLNQISSSKIQVCFSDLYDERGDANGTEVEIIFSGLSN